MLGSLRNRIPTQTADLHCRAKLKLQLHSHKPGMAVSCLFRYAPDQIYAINQLLPSTADQNFSFHAKSLEYKLY